MLREHLPNAFEIRPLDGLLVIYHLLCGYYRKKLIDNAHYKSHKFWRYFNEMPTLILFAVVILVVVKPTF